MGRVRPVSSPRRTPAYSLGRCWLITARARYSSGLLLIFQNVFPPTVSSPNCRTVTDPTTGLPGIILAPGTSSATALGPSRSSGSVTGPRPLSRASARSPLRGRSSVKVVAPASNTLP